jgi:predicted CopG family antitoxin
MGSANDHIRVSKRVKKMLDRRKREGESYNDVMERVLSDDRDLLAGFGAGKGTDRPEKMREVHEDGKKESATKIEQLAQDRSE